LAVTLQFVREMKGLTLGSRIDWPCAQALLGEDNPHLFLQYLMLGMDSDIESHLVVPTQWSMLYTATRTFLLCKIWQKNAFVANNQERLNVLEKQESCLTRCAICCDQLRYHEVLPYQVALRIVGGYEESDDSWNYSMLICMLCRKCQTTPWYTLVPTDLAIYPLLCVALSRWCFAAPIDANADITAQYLKRIDWLNDLVRPVLLLTMGGNRCAHCQHRDEDETRFVACKGGCGLSYCRRGDCLAKSGYYHGLGMCEQLAAGELFHTGAAVSIDITGEVNFICL
jgi:hypothetical protein